jgi:hypothetical protein
VGFFGKSEGKFMQELKEKTDLKADLRDGTSLPLGPSQCGTGVNFAIFSQYATHIRLELFDHHEDSKAARVIDLDPIHHRTGNIWHVWIEGIRPGQLYAYRVEGPYNPKDGHRFNFNKLLLDPCAKEISRLPTWDFGVQLVGMMCLFLMRMRYVRWSMIQEACLNAFSRTSNLNGMRIILQSFPGQKLSSMNCMSVVLQIIQVPV